MHTWEAACGGSSSCVSTAHEGDIDGVLDFWLWSGSVLIIAGICAVNQQMTDLSVSLTLSLYICLSSEMEKQNLIFSATVVPIHS